MIVNKCYYAEAFLNIFLLFMLCSCNADNNQKLLKDISLLQSKSVDYCKDRWEYSNILKEKIKYVVYWDSINCTSCAIHQLELWKPLLEYSENYNGLLNFYFIFHPSKKDIDTFQIVLGENTNFDYPILIDTLGEFERLNPHLPKNQALHTFLLDENNRVILVGNPLRNKKIKEMFYKIVEEKLGKPGEVAVKEN